ncbi:MAG: DUF1839 family protein [Solirubrobacteraceae bacterium]
MSAHTVRGLTSLSGQDPQSYRQHALHAPDRSYAESNCYQDVIIELLHACGYEPLAALAHIVRIDFEGDQWTFYKPPAQDLEALYGIDIHEMQPYRPLALQIAEQLELGRSLIVELDAFHLPDTVATSYRCEHVKTACAADAIDLDGGTLRYFHLTGLFELDGEDYRAVMRIGDWPAVMLPPYTEIVRFDVGERLEGDALREASSLTLRRHLAKRPAVNPVETFAAALVAALPTLLAGDLEQYHLYAFATVRILGSGFELLRSYADWLLGADAAPLTAPTGAMVDACKALSFRLARRREFDPRELLGVMARSWEQTMTLLCGFLT